MTRLIISEDTQAVNAERNASSPSLGTPEHTENDLIKAECFNALAKTISEKIAALADQIDVDAKQLDQEFSEQVFPSKKGKKTLTEKVLEELEDKQYSIELFCDPAGDAHFSIMQDGHPETYKLKSRATKKIIRNIRYQKHKKGLTSSTLDEVIDTLEAKAVYEGRIFDTALRIAHKNGNVYIDLCDPSWQCVEITPNEVNIIQHPPFVKFVRAYGMLPLPVPALGGSYTNKLSLLRPLINVTESGWRKIVIWLLSTFCEGPYWILKLTGEQGTAKTSTTTIIRNLIDPSEFPVSPDPGDKIIDLFMAASNGHILALDNLSAISVKLSDTLCIIATGGTIRLRAYHTNDGTEVAFKVKKPIIINGIDFSVRDDAASRELSVSLSPLNKTIDEKMLKAQFDNIKAEVLGALCEIVSVVLKKLPSTETPQGIRMADAAKWTTAAENALGWERGEVLKLLKDNRADSVEDTIESDIFAAALVELLNEQPDLEISTKELSRCVLLQAGLLHPPKWWPLTGKKIGILLQRLAPSLRHPTYGITFERVKILQEETGKDARGYKFKCSNAQRQKPKMPAAEDFAVCYEENYAKDL